MKLSKKKMTNIGITGEAQLAGLGQSLPKYLLHLHTFGEGLKTWASGAFSDFYFLNLVGFISFLGLNDPPPRGTGSGQRKWQYDS